MSTGRPEETKNYHDLHRLHRHGGPHRLIPGHPLVN